MDSKGLRIFDIKGLFPFDSPTDLLRMMPGAPDFIIPDDMNKPTGNAYADCMWRCFVKEGGIDSVMYDIAIFVLTKKYPTKRPPGWVLALFGITESASTVSTGIIIENCRNDCGENPCKYEVDVFSNCKEIWKRNKPIVPVVFATNL